MTILKKLSVWVVTLALVAAFLPLFNALPSGLSERWEPNKVAHADDKGDGGSSLFGGSLSLSPNDGVAVRMQHNSSFQFVALYNLNGAVYDVSSYATWTIDGLSPAMYNLIGGHLTVYHLDSGSGTITAQFDGQSHSLFIEFLEPFPSQPTACMAGYGGLTAMNPGQSTTQAFYWSFDPPYIGNGVALFEVGSGAQGHVLTSKQPSSNDNGWAMSVAGNANYGVKRLPVLVDIQSDDYTGVYGCNDISIYVPAPDWSTAPIFNFMCDTVSQSVARGQTANFLLSGNPSGTYSSQLSVTMASNPAGPVMNPTPVLLNPGNGYLGVASVPTGASTPAGTYTLTFTATDGVSSQECESELVILPITGSATLLFDNSPGPTTPTPPNGTTGVLSWTTANAASCSGSMAQGVDTTTPSPWTGPKAAANSGAQTFNVNNLQPNTTYIFRIDCVTSFGDPIEPDTVTVNVGAAQTPTATLQCQGAESKDPHAGPCEVAYDSAALLVWSSEYATSCSITPGSWGSSTAGSGSTPNLTSNIQYSLSCTGPGGTSEPSTVEISVITDHNYNFDLSVYSDTQSQGNTSITNLIVSNPIHGFNAPVTMSVQSISPAGLPLSNVTFNNNPTNSPYGTPVTAVIQTAGVPLNTYTITFRSDGGTSYDPKTRTFLLQVTAPSSPQPPGTIDVNNDPGACGTLIISWNTHASHGSNVTYRVYRSNTQQPWNNGVGWTYTGISVDHNGSTASYIRTDSNPFSGSNYYVVTAAIGASVESASGVSNGVVPIPCEASLEGSYKRIIAGSSLLAGERCSSSSNLALPDSLIYQAGDIVHFEICVRNSGTETLNNVSVTENIGKLQNLENVQFVSAFNSCASGSGVGPYNIGTMDPGEVCSFIVRATISNPGGPATTLHWFQNFADVASSLVSRTVSTLPEVFTIGSGIPTRTETAP